VVSEAEASVYSASAFASQELPELDVSLRGAVAQREPPVMLRVWGRVERVPDDDASGLALWERCAYRH
jgi:hypothetical protein